jgi:hypothetical protein
VKAKRGLVLDRLHGHMLAATRRQQIAVHAGEHCNSGSVGSGQLVCWCAAAQARDYIRRCGAVSVALYHAASAACVALCCRRCICTWTSSRMRATRPAGWQYVQAAHTMTSRCSLLQHTLHCAVQMCKHSNQLLGFHLQTLKIAFCGQAQTLNRSAGHAGLLCSVACRISG